MNLTALSQRALGASEMFFRKNGTTILTTAGVAGFAATTVFVGKAVLKAQPTVDKIKVDVEHHKKEYQHTDMTQKELQQRIGRTLVLGGAELMKIFWPAIAVGGLSITCVIASHKISNSQKAALAAAYTGLDAAYRAYRKRVAEEIGEDRERELYRRVRTVESVDEEGLPCEIIDYSDIRPSVYGVFFDESNKNWTRTPEYNKFFVKTIQDWANNRLQAYGFLFLNEVYEELGFERTQAGQRVGWRLDARDRGTGDGYVDFGLDDIGDENSRAFSNHLEGTVFLDFNVDGEIIID